MALGEWETGVGEVAREKRQGMLLKQSVGGEDLGKEQRYESREGTKPVFLKSNLHKSDISSFFFLKLSDLFPAFPPPF